MAQGRDEPDPPASLGQPVIDRTSEILELENDGGESAIKPILLERSSYKVDQLSSVEKLKR